MVFIDDIFSDHNALFLYYFTLHDKLMINLSCSDYIIKLFSSCQDFFIVLI